MYAITHAAPSSGSEDSAIPVSLDGHRLIHTNGTLLLRAVKAEDSGYYTCTATNTGGFDTIIVNLLVQGEALQSRWLVSTGTGIPSWGREKASSGCWGGRPWWN